MTYPNWFDVTARKPFERHLLPLAGKPGLRFLQIGAFTGDATVWLHDNVLTALSSTLTDVDTWHGSDEPGHDPFDWADVERVYIERRRELARWGNVARWKGTSAEFFTRDWMPFDFIYIDASHEPYDVLNDGVSAYKVLLVGGLLAFDDYQWVQPREGRPTGPALAVDAIEKCYRGRLELLQLGAQAWFRKIA